MNYHKFKIEKYKAIKDSDLSIISDAIPVIGINESGKSSVLEAITRFDFRNDQLSLERDWKFINRYRPEEDSFSIVATVNIDTTEKQSAVSIFSEEEQVVLTNLVDSGSSLTIKRIFKTANPTTPTYSISDQESELVERFCREIIQKLPRIFYFDNFLFSPFPNTVEMPSDYFTNTDTVLNENQTILENMFSLSSFDLRSTLQNTDETTKDANFTEVSRLVSNKLVADWKKIHISRSELDSSVTDIRVKLVQNRVNPLFVDISICEKFKDENGEERELPMPLNERSQGFRWFFNFALKKCYGTKGERKFIYLFDEPGSYLHNSAQSTLLRAITELSSSHPVIYSTHSEFLLDPEIININNIKVIQKNDREIKLIALAQVRGVKNEGALSTLYNALRTKIPVSSTLDQKVIVTEGITDYYFWKMLTKKLIFLPGFGAGQNEYLISIAIGTSKKYIALFDGDNAGQQAIEKYQRYFGDHEKNNWKKLLNSNGDEVILENLLSDEDKERIKQITQTQDLKRAITTLFFSNSKNQFWSSIDNETKLNLNASLGLFKTQLNIRNNSQFNYGLGL